MKKGNSSFVVGTLKGCFTNGAMVNVPSSGDPNGRDYWLSEKTSFVGAADSKTVISGLREGLTVNLWLDRDGAIKFASPNWR